MLIAGWSLTNACNLKCIHCYHASGKRKQDELTLEQCIKAADELKRAGVAAVNFGGGECNLRTDFIDLCKYLNEIGIKISYTTNGTTFKIIEPYLHLFHDVGVSIDFANSEKHDWFRGLPGTFEKAMDSIDRLIKEGVETEIVTCLTKLNSSQEELSKLYALAQKHNVKSWRLNRYRSTGRGFHNDSILKMNNLQVRQAFNYLNSLRKDNQLVTPEPVFRAIYGGTYQLEGDPSGRHSFRIQTDGEVTPSVFLSESGGNIKEKSIEEIMQSPVFKRIRNREPAGKCVSCNEYYHCKGGDAGLSYFSHGHFNGPDPMCFKDTTQPRNSAVVKKIEKDPNIHALYLCTLYIPVGEKK